MNPLLLPLFVALPLLAAAVLVLVRVPAIERALMIGVPAAVGAGGGGLLVVHASVPALAHGVGGYVPGVAIPFVSDSLSALMLAVTGLVTAVCAWYLVLTGEDRTRFVPALTLLLTAGVNGALLTGDLFNLFVWIEVMLLPSYALIAVTGTSRRLGIGRLFVLVNLLTSTMLLMGVGFVYGVAGSVNLGVLTGAAAADPRLGAAAAVVLVALGVKAGAVPVHGWLPRAYPATSAGMMALFSALHTKVALYAIYRVSATLYDGRPAPWVGVLAVVVVATMLAGAFGTYARTSLRGVLAHQMVAGVGHILVGVLVLTPAAISAGLFYLVHHVVTMAGLLLAAGAIERACGTGSLARIGGLARRSPALAAVVVVGLFSLVGLPPTSGLWGKVGLVLASADAPAWQAWLLVGAILVASAASLMALQRLWRGAFWDPPERDPGPAGAFPIGLLVPAAALLACSVAMFVAAAPVFEVTERAAAALTDPTPYAEAVLR